MLMRPNVDPMSSAKSQPNIAKLSFNWPVDTDFLSGCRMRASDSYRASHVRGPDDGAEVGGAHGVLQATCASNEARWEQATRDERGKDKKGRVHKKGQAVEGLASKVHLARAPMAMQTKGMFSNCSPTLHGTNMLQ